MALGLLVSVSVRTPAQDMPHDDQMTQATGQVSEFRRIEQPLWAKGLVTLGGFGLIGLELWWFLFSRSQSR